MLDDIFGTSDFLTSLITNLSLQFESIFYDESVNLTFRNKKWLNHKLNLYVNFSEIQYVGTSS